MYNFSLLCFNRKYFQDKGIKFAAVILHKGKHTGEALIRGGQKGMGTNSLVSIRWCSYRGTLLNDTETKWVGCQDVVFYIGSRKYP